MLQNTSKTLGSKKSMVYNNTHRGGGKPYLVHGLLEFQNEKKITFDPFFGALNVLKLEFFKVSFDCLYKRHIIITILNE